MVKEPTIVGMPYSEFAKKYGEEKARQALQRIYGTTDPQQAAQIERQRMQQVLGISTQPQQPAPPKPSQTQQISPPPSGPTSPEEFIPNVTQSTTTQTTPEIKIPADPTIVGMPYSKFVEKFGERKSKRSPTKNLRDYRPTTSRCN
jgi:hypothetical protein